MMKFLAEREAKEEKNPVINQHYGVVPSSPIEESLIEQAI